MKWLMSKLFMLVCFVRGYHQIRWHGYVTLPCRCGAVPDLPEYEE